MPEPDIPSTHDVRREWRGGATSADELQALLLRPEELALLDVREAKAFHAAHLNLARSAPLSSLELQIAAFVPRRSATVVVYDDAGEHDAAALRSVSLLQRLGYSEVRHLQGGLHAWKERGLPWIDGWNTLIKTFGDRVRQHYATPVLPLSELEMLRSRNKPVELIDVRPSDEFAFLHIEGAHNHAGTELALRDFGDTDRQGDKPLWAINCFSRTRGILGATTLAVLGHRHAAFVEDGVMAWGLRGGPVSQDSTALPDLPPARVELLAARAEKLRSLAAIETIDRARLEEWRDDSNRTLYIFDVRPVPSAATAAAADVRHVPGGQVLMHFEQIVGTRNARVVLVDDPHGLRAAVTAFWLAQFNQCEVAVLSGEVPPWAAPKEVASDDGAASSVDPQTLDGWLASADAVVVDVGPSEDFERSHIPGARYLLPASLLPLAPVTGQGRRIVFTSPDGAAARVVARDAALEWPKATIHWLTGGTRAWARADQPTSADHEPSDLLTPFDDDWGSTMRVGPSMRDAAWRHYLAWERTLSERVVRDPTVQFKLQKSAYP